MPFDNRTDRRPLETTVEAESRTLQALEKRFNPLDRADAPLYGAGRSLSADELKPRKAEPVAPWQAAQRYASEAAKVPNYWLG